MGQGLAERLAELIAEGRAEVVGETAFVSLATLASGTRVGLGADGSWHALSPEGTLYRFGAGSEGRFAEVIEGKRADFDEQLVDAAEALGLPGPAVMHSFPAAALVRSVLAQRSSYLTRLGLLWLLTTELRELRAEIAAVAQDKLLPVPIRDLAARLTVPE